LTSEKVKRDVDNDLLSLYGGDAIAGGTGIISLFGKTSGNANAVEVIVGDAAGTGNVMVTGWIGGAAPRMDMNGYNITGIKTIVNATDAVNKSYVDSRSSYTDLTWNSTYATIWNLSVTNSTLKSYMDWNLSATTNPLATTANLSRTNDTVRSQVYPIGVVFITTTADNPSAMLGGFGTWTALGNGYVLVGV
jgi:hypothetical protein